MKPYSSFSLFSIFFSWSYSSLVLVLALRRAEAVPRSGLYPVVLACVLFLLFPCTRSGLSCTYCMLF